MHFPQCSFYFYSMEKIEVKRCFYNFKYRFFFVKNLDFDMYNYQAWKSTEANPSRKDDCHFFGEFNSKDFGKFENFVKENERIGVRDPILPELKEVLEYFRIWKENNET